MQVHSQMKRDLGEVGKAPSPGASVACHWVCSTPSVWVWAVLQRPSEPVAGGLLWMVHGAGKVDESLAISEELCCSPRGWAWGWTFQSSGQAWPLVPAPARGNQDPQRRAISLASQRPSSTQESPRVSGALYQRQGQRPDIPCCTIGLYHRATNSKSVITVYRCSNKWMMHQQMEPHQRGPLYWCVFFGTCYWRKPL